MVNEMSRAKPSDPKPLHHALLDEGEELLTQRAFDRQVQSTLKTSDELLQSGVSKETRSRKHRWLSANSSRPEDYLQDLRRKMHLAQQGLKAMCESSDWAIRQNEEVTRKLHKENNRLRHAINKTREKNIEMTTIELPMPQEEIEGKYTLNAPKIVDNNDSEEGDSVKQGTAAEDDNNSRTAAGSRLGSTRGSTRGSRINSVRGSITSQVSESSQTRIKRSSVGSDNFQDPADPSQNLQTFITSQQDELEDGKESTALVAFKSVDTGKIVPAELGGRDKIVKWGVLRNRRGTAEDVLRLRNKFDALNWQATSKEEEIESLSKNLKKLLSWKSKDGTTFRQNPFTRKVASLEDRLNKVMADHNEAVNKRNSHTQMITRLTLDVQRQRDFIGALERMLLAKQYNQEELAELADDATKASVIAESEQAELEQQVKEERNLRNRIRSRAKKERARGNKLIKEAITKGQERNASLAAKQQQQQEDAPKMDPKKYLVARRHAEAILEIEQVSGITDVNRIISKYLGHELASKRLKQVAAQSKERIRTLRTVLRVHKTELEQHRYASQSHKADEQASAHIEKIDKRIQVAQESCELHRRQYEKYNRLLLQVRTGVGHLVDLLNHASGNEITSAVSEESIKGVLNQCEGKLLDIIGHFQKKQQRRNSHNSPSTEDTASNRGVAELASDAGLGVGVPLNLNLRIPRDNIRIQMD